MTFQIEVLIEYLNKFPKEQKQSKPNREDYLAIPPKSTYITTKSKSCP